MNPESFYRDLPTLTTPRLVLRRLRREDAPDYFAFAGDPQVTRYLRWGPHPSLQHSADYLAEVAAGYERGSDGLWGIELAAQQVLVGAIHLMEINERHSRADVGVVLARACWGQGYAGEVLRRVLAFSFQELGLNRVQALSIVGNARGRRMLERAGMQHEGVLREYALQKGAFQSFDLFALLAGEFSG